MLIPLSLIKSFIQLDMPPAKIGEILTLLGIEVDHIYNEVPPFAGVVVGEVVSAERHPDAKNLQIAKVSDGKQTYTLVCAAPNCRAGLKTAFARLGAVIGDMRIEKATIRGIESSGMLCAASELKVGADDGGIIELPQEMKAGEDLVHVLWDPVFELSLTPNLGHCMSALGVARELSASLQFPLHREKTSMTHAPLNKEIVVHNFELCPRYMCCLIEGVKVGPSPFWLRRQLEACGQKSINNVVDVANYIMMKVGQPLHAFDADLLEGQKIEVGPAKHLEKFLGLDGVEREVPAGSLLIFDAKKPVAIAGIMGGANSAVSDKTTRVLLEAAYFDPISVRNTSRKIGLRSESSQRFEKGVDIVGVEEALHEAAKLLGGRVLGVADVKKGFTPRVISYRTDRINQLLGTKLSATEIEEIFQRLGFKTKDNKAEIPSFRNDVTEEIDLVEEVARIYGYNNIEKGVPHIATSQIPNDPVFVYENELRRRLVGCGLTEFLTCDLISPKLADVCRAITPASMELLKAAYSKSEEYSILRTSLLPGLLQVAKRNIDQKNLNMAAFEMGRIHFMQNGKVVEIPMVAILLSGKGESSHWSRKASDFDFFDLKGMIENIVNSTFKPSKHLTFHPGRQADICSGDLTVGSLGEVHPALLEQFDINQRVLYAELDLLHLMKLRKTHLRIMPLSQFPSSERDWTLPLDPKLAIERIFQVILSEQLPLLEKVELIDLYMPEGSDKKNATFRFTYRDLAKTISFEEVEHEHAKIMDTVAKFLHSV